MQLTIKSLKDGKVFTVTAQEAWVPQDLKAAIENEHHVPASAQRLVFAGRPMNENATLQDQGVEDGKTVQLIARLTEEPKTYDGGPLTIKSLKDGKTYTVQAEAAWTPSDLRAAIEQQADIPASAQRLVPQDRVAQTTVSGAEQRTLK